MASRLGPSSSPADGSGSREDLSHGALRIRFVGRERELAAAVAHLMPQPDEPAGRVVLVRGDSGTGKTFFTRELAQRLYGVAPGGLFLFVDVANDEFQSTRTIGALLKMALVEGGMTPSSSVSVPEGLSLDRFRQGSRRRGFGRGVLRAIVNALGTVIGVGSAAGTVVGSAEDQPERYVEDEFAAYLSWAARRTTVFLAIDNLQFLNLDVRLTIESVLQRVGANVRLIAVDRTVDGASELEPPIRCFADALMEVRLRALTSEQTKELVAGALGPDDPVIDRLSEDIFTKTNGLPKEIEYCLRQYSLEVGRGAAAGAIEGLLSTLDRLPLIHRQFLVIAALLDGGVKPAVARGAIRRLVGLHDEASLNEIVDDLVARDYLRLNTESGDRLRPGHERIAMAVRELADDEVREDVRASLVQEISAALEESEAVDNETYLLHCLVGLQTAQELTRHLHYISRLIQSQRRQDQFSYLVAIAEELSEVLPLLPEHALNDLLDAMQKSSAFEQGLQLVRTLDSKGVPGASERRIHQLKYLTQAYRYDDALRLLDDIQPGEWKDAYRVNALLALDRRDEARSIAEPYRARRLTEATAVMRRNTIVLHDPETALNDLDLVYAFFEREQSDYRLATVDTNRGLVLLHAGRFGDAARSLERAESRMAFVGSREIYQAQINMAIRSALLEDHAASLELLDRAALHVPRALILDQVKIAMNRAVIEWAAGQQTLRTCIDSLERCRAQIKGLQMPYLERALERNLATAVGRDAPVEGENRASLEIAFPSPPGLVVSGPWWLMMSVHWRY